MGSRRLSRTLDTETDVTVASATGEDCVICLSSITDDCVRTPCQHHFHQGCLDQYLLTHGCQEECESWPRVQAVRRARCPICRGSLRLPLSVEAHSTSGRPIEVVDVPCVGSYCHFDRGYTFTSLGGFQRPGMLYVHTSNDDRRTPASEVMWVVESQVRVAVHLNFRTEDHVGATGVEKWLRARGWRKNPNLASTVSTGIPNGPYSGPVYSKECEPGTIELMGSNTWEGVYFVFIEQRELLHQTPPLRRDDVSETSAAEIPTEASISDEAASIPPVLGPSLGPISRPRYEGEVTPPLASATGSGTGSAILTDSVGRHRQPLTVRRLLRSVTASSVNGEGSAASVLPRRCPRRRRSSGGSAVPSTDVERQTAGVNVATSGTVNMEARGESRVEVSAAPAAQRAGVTNTAPSPYSRVRPSATSHTPAASAAARAGVSPRPPQPPGIVLGPHVQIPVSPVPLVDNPLSQGRRVIMLRHSEGSSSRQARP